MVIYLLKVIDTKTEIKCILSLLHHVTIKNIQKNYYIHIMVIYALFSYLKKNAELKQIISVQLLDACVCHNAMFIYIRIITVIVVLKSEWLHMYFHV